MNIFKYEFKSYLKTTLIWTVSLIGVVMLFMSLLSSISESAATIQKVFSSYPESVRKAMGMVVETIASPLGFYSFILNYILLCGAIQAMILGVSIISKEYREKTSDFLFSKPITRQKIFSSKLMAAISCLLVTFITYTVTSFTTAKLASDMDFDGMKFIMMSFTLFFIQLMYFALGVLFANIFSRLKGVVSISLGVVFGFYVLTMIVNVVDADKARYLSPFKYFDLQYIIKNAAFETTFVVLGAVWVMLMLGISYVMYVKRDIHTV
jgi:ABC-2 type transport system permease protein